MSDKVVARVKPNGREIYDRRRKMKDFYTTDQRLLAEIRDLLIMLVNAQPATQLARIANATQTLANEVETLRKVIDREDPHE